MFSCVCQDYLAYFCWQLAFYLHLPTSGRKKHSQNGPAATFRPKGLCSPMYNGLFTFYCPSQYISSFSRWRRKSEKFPFFTKKNRLPVAVSILMPPTFPISSLNRYTPKFSGLTQKLAWCQQFGLQVLPK